MKRNLPMVFAMACCTAFAAMAVQFSNLSANVVDDGLEVSFAASNLPAERRATFTATAGATAVWGCFNNGGNNPNSKNKRSTVTARVANSVYLSLNTNDRIRETITLRAPRDQNFACPKGQTLKLSEVTFRNVRVTHRGSNTTASVPGVFHEVVQEIK